MPSSNVCSFTVELEVSLQMDIPTSSSASGGSSRANDVVTSLHQ